jgi:hypothetical protein
LVNLNAAKSRRRENSPRLREPGVNDIAVDALAGTTEVEVVEARETWSEYRLTDGTVLRVKPIMIAISRVEDRDATNGEPVYNMRSTLITDVRGVKRPPDMG